MNNWKWERAEPGIWRMTIGARQGHGLSPLACMGRTPKREALERMGEAELPFAAQDIRVETAEGCVIVSFPLTGREALYGTGLQFMRLNQRGRTRYLRVNSDPKQDTGETHAPVPLLVSDRGYGVLADTSRIVTMYCGSTVRQEETVPGEVRDRNTDKAWKATPPSVRAEIRLPAEGAVLYWLAGPTLAEVVRRYNLLCGGGTLPPRWGLGFWHRVPTLYDEEAALAEALEFRERDVPCDVIGLEPGWHSRSYPVTYEWDNGRFPDPAAFLQRMERHGFRVNLWENPFVAPESELYEPLKPLSGSHSVWGGLAPDFTLPAAQELYMRQHDERHVSLGVAGYKLDECDGSELTNHSWMFPAHARFPSGLDGEQMRQLYGLALQRITDDLFRKHDRRTYGLVRASGAGASSLPYVLYSDLYDHRQFVRALCNASFCGLLWTPEVRKARSAEDWVRRMQTVCFSPLAMLNAWGDGTKPWSYPETESIIRHYIRLRMRLLPYLYTAFARYRKDGIPPFKAMPFAVSQHEASAYAAGTDGSTTLNTTDAAYGKRKQREWDDQFMVGESLLVAPLFEGESEREVLLPVGVWYGLETGERYDGGRIVRIQAPLERIPVFVRDGAVVPMMPALPHAPAAGEKVPLTIVHFGEAPGEGLLYDDDGETFAYERGDGRWGRMSAARNAGGVWEGKLEGPEEGWLSFADVRWQFGMKRLEPSEG